MQKHDWGEVAIAVIEHYLGTPDRVEAAAPATEVSLPAAEGSPPGAQAEAGGPPADEAPPPTVVSTATDRGDRADRSLYRGRRAR